MVSIKSGLMCQHVFEITQTYHCAETIWWYMVMCSYVWLYMFVGALSWSRMMPVGKGLVRPVNVYSEWWCFARLVVLSCAACLTGTAWSAKGMSSCFTIHVDSVKSFCWNIPHVFLKDRWLSILTTVSRSTLMMRCWMKRGKQRVVFCMGMCACMYACIRLHIYVSNTFCARKTSSL